MSDKLKIMQELIAGILTGIEPKTESEIFALDAVLYSDLKLAKDSEQVEPMSVDVPRYLDHPEAQTTAS